MPQLSSSVISRVDITLNPNGGEGEENKEQKSEKEDGVSKKEGNEHTYVVLF